MKHATTYYKDEIRDLLARAEEVGEIGTFTRLALLVMLRHLPDYS